MIDYLLFPLRALWSLALHIWDALDEWRHVQIALWRYLEIKRGRVQTIPLEEMRARLWPEGMPEDEPQATRE